MTKGEETRRAILDRATDLARLVGLDGLTIGGLADELGLSKSGLFAHFGSKEALQVEVIRRAREQFVAEVMTPALKSPRGEPRVRTIFERWIVWGQRPGGCIFVALTAELDDRPGPARDALVEALRDWLEALATAAGIAVREGHFRKNLDIQQFAFELEAIMLGGHQQLRLFADPQAVVRMRRAFDALLERSHPA